MFFVRLQFSGCQPDRNRRNSTPIKKASPFVIDEKQKQNSLKELTKRDRERLSDWNQHSVQTKSSFGLITSFVRRSIPSSQKTDFFQFAQTVIFSLSPKLQKNVQLSPSPQKITEQRIAKKNTLTGELRLKYKVSKMFVCRLVFFLSCTVNFFAIALFQNIFCHYFLCKSNVCLPKLKNIAFCKRPKRFCHK